MTKREFVQHRREECPHCGGTRVIDWVWEVITCTKCRLGEVLLRFNPRRKWVMMRCA